MPHCSAIGCRNKSGSKSKVQLELEKHKKITFHCFPKNSDKRKVWIDRMGLTETSLSNYAHLCSLHFSTETFDLTSACKVRLKDNAVPNNNLKVHDMSNITTTADLITTNQNTVVPQEMCVIDIETIKVEHYGADEAPTSIVEDEQIKIKQEIVNSPRDCGTRDASSQTLPKPESVDKATWASKSLLANSPTTMHLRSVMKNQKDTYEKKIKLLKQTVRRKEIRITSLMNMLTELKKK